MEELFISCPHHFEELLYTELKNLGIPKLRLGFCGVFAPADMINVYLINYCSRIATRVLWPLTRFGCPDKEALYTMAKRIGWAKYLSIDKTFAIDANVSHHNLTNSLFAALVVKDAICDYFRDKTGERPSIDIQNPDVQLNLFIQKGQATLYIDTSGAPLHKRGWRLENTEATIHESLAAALLIGAGFKNGVTFCDPFCGSGTFLVEAAMIATNTPAGFFRKSWGFMQMPFYREEEWLKFKETADSKIIPLEKGMICGSDKDIETFKTCYRHLKGTSFRGLIELENQDVATYHPPTKPKLVLCNPPYGKRLELNKSVSLGLTAFIERECTEDTHIFVLTSEPALADSLGREAKEEIAFKNGGMSVSLYYLEKP
ncbi:MAG: THUMP domain-containing protein [Chlamydiae bacterium]|nr:THUMP domain-containing protein [Chlamydiota bacterium]